MHNDVKSRRKCLSVKWPCEKFTFWKLLHGRLVTIFISVCYTMLVFCTGDIIGIVVAVIGVILTVTALLATIVFLYHRIARRHKKVMPKFIIWYLWARTESNSHLCVSESMSSTYVDWRGRWSSIEQTYFMHTLFFSDSFVLLLCNCFCPWIDTTRRGLRIFHTLLPFCSHLLASFVDKILLGLSMQIPIESCHGGITHCVQK